MNAEARGSDARGNGAPDAWRALRPAGPDDERLIVGLMTGTSADAVDAALVRFRGRGLAAGHRVLAYRESPLDDALRREVLEIAAAETLAPERLMRLDATLGERYADAVLELLRAEGIEPGAVAAIGSHGQTVRHLPRAANGGRALTLQLGSAAVLAERTGIAVVSDFRTRDTAAGGEGAPLVPIADWWLFRSASEARVLLNLGGMANLTHLPRDAGPGDVLAFDTGPGNAVLDGLVAVATGGLARRDEGGQKAAQGRADEGLLEELLADPFFSTNPPRSTGRERFGAGYAARLHDLGEPLGLSLEDLLATAVELTARSVAGAIRQFVRPRGAVDRIYASGGGVRNATLMAALRRELGGIPLERLDMLGVEADAKEALAFALLAHLTLAGETGSLPGATGARHPAVLGHVTPGVPGRSPAGETT
ncbi:MAG TPA: anhydro-N-acetylmuramic acid kinase [Candidatus Acidoferrales bacterium]|nr:anhydro-N-acetylmuramic acid kinase [Candidatus Acidoferrales bacterium]